MGMAFGLEKGQCAEANLKASRSMVPKALEPYVMGESKKFVLQKPIILDSLHGFSYDRVNFSILVFNKGKHKL